jgi:hypothetical protein
MISFIKRHALVTFFVLAYALSWGNYILSASWLLQLALISGANHICRLHIASEYIFCVS